VSRRRLDAELVRRGFAATRAEAMEAVLAGRVTVAGAPALKGTTLVASDQAVHVADAIRPFVSRGGAKLGAALERFAVDPAGRSCLDAGASTGGFTDRLLRAGAARVAAVDVGYGQLAWQLRTDPRVLVLERTNVTSLTASMLGSEPELVVADLSFISLRSVVSSLAALATDDAAFIVLVKPQFEAKRAEAWGGVVRDPAVWLRVIQDTAIGFDDTGVTPLGVMVSPLRGPAGNVEFFLHARRGAPRTTLDLQEAVVAAEGLEG
jgi:23S rRNA (cytidine1920-2'-O)/16S rRNA (cytidine1409-2'-O)-methyltransferase